MRLARLSRWLALPLLLLCSTPALADTIVADSCNNTSGSTDVQDAIDLAVTDDVVALPAGACNWDTQVVVTVGITLEGDGVGSTVVEDDVASGSMLAWICESGEKSRLTGIEFNAGTRASGNGNGILSFDCDNLTGTVLELDNFETDNLNGLHLVFRDVVGVVHDWDCFHASPDFCYIVRNPSWDDVGSFGDNSWTQDVTWGGDEWLFIEDNTFTYSSPGQCSDGHEGSRVIVRFNSMNDCHLVWHGTESTGRQRGGRACEVYGNVYDHVNNSLMMFMRSGSCLFWGNSGDIGGTSVARVSNLRAVQNFTFAGADGTSEWDINDDANNPYETCTVASGGTLTVTCGGSPGWTTDEWTGYTVHETSACTECFSVITSNTSDTLTFSSGGGFGDMSFAMDDTLEINLVLQIMDGIGIGGGSLLTTGNPPSPAPEGWNDQEIFPSYEWLNTDEMNDIDIGAGVCWAPMCEEGVHYHNDVGVGTVSELPGTCDERDWFWVTDEGEWNSEQEGVDGRAYKCDGANDWSLAYTPADYPSAYRSDGGGGEPSGEFTPGPPRVTVRP
jgi:hypothetical protein